MYRRKYGNKKVEYDGIKFDSKREMQRYCELKLLERAGEIKNLQLQPKFVLQESFKKNGKTHRAINYIADFMYEENDKIKVEDSKGFKTDVYAIKKKMFEYKYPELTITEV